MGTHFCSPLMIEVPVLIGKVRSMGLVAGIWINSGDAVRPQFLPQISILLCAGGSYGFEA